MPIPKRSASLRANAPLAKRPRLAHSTGKKTQSIVPHGKTRPTGHTRDPSDSDSESDNTTSDEDDDEQSPALDQGQSLGTSGSGNLLFTVMSLFTYPLIASDEKCSRSPAATYPPTPRCKTAFHSLGRRKTCLVPRSTKDDIQGRACFTCRFSDGDCPREDTRYCFQTRRKSYRADNCKAGEPAAEERSRHRTSRAFQGACGEQILKGEGVGGVYLCAG